MFSSSWQSVLDAIFCYAITFPKVYGLIAPKLSGHLEGADGDAAGI